MNADLFVSVLKKCESASGAGTKKIIQAALAELDTAGRFLMHMAMDPYVVFGIRKFEIPDTGYASADPEIYELLEVLAKLSQRELTGDAARQAWAETLCSFTAETAKYLERIIDKDPRGGFSADTFNKVWPENRIPTFEVMLADKCATIEEFDKNVSLPAWAAHKFDGNRSIAIVRKINDEYVIEYRARSGKLSEHLEGLFDDDFKIIRELMGQDFVADGEAFAGDFTETMNAKKADNDKAKQNMRFRLFFVMPYTHWLAQKTDITMGENLERCRTLMEYLAKKRAVGAIPKVILEDGKMVNTYAEMMAYCDEVIVAGEEGLIVKDLKAEYVWDRSYAWCKIKKFYDADLRILGFYPGRKKSRLENSLGGVVGAGYLEDGTLVLTRVGSGFSDAMRDEIWNNQEKYLDQTFVCKYQEVTKAKGKEVHSLRFGTFEHFRDDKPIDISDEDMELMSESIAKALKS